jgi:hypothetical protein
VRISDENARWLEEQGGSLSAAADRTIQWAHDALDAMDETDDPQNPQIAQPGDDPGDSYQPPPAEERPLNPGGPSGTRTSSSSARRARTFAVSIRRPW